MSQSSKTRKRRASGAFSAGSQERAPYRINGETDPVAQDAGIPVDGESSLVDQSLFTQEASEAEVFALAETKARAEKHRKRKETPEE